MEGEGDDNPNLPQELITEILVRLPVKFLLQYKSVSKPWLTLISSPQFAKTHLSFSANDHTRHSILFKETIYPPLKDNLKHCSVSSLFNESVTTQAFDSDYPTKNTCTSLCILCSVNGLVCLQVGLDVLVIWNPSTRMFKQVSVIRPTMTCQFTYGIGYDEVHDDYKVVHISFDSRTDSVVKIKIYSLNSDSWTSLDGFQGLELIPLSEPTKFVNGKIHWGNTSLGIMSIDLVDEKIGEVKERFYGEEEYTIKLGVLGSDLCVLCNHSPGQFRITHADVWVMKEYGVKESWTKLYTIECIVYSFVLPAPVFMSNKGEILLLFKSKLLMIYNPEDKSVRYPDITGVDGHLWAEPYIESLVCPISQTEQMTQ